MKVNSRFCIHNFLVIFGFGAALAWQLLQVRGMDPQLVTDDGHQLASLFEGQPVVEKDLPRGFPQVGRAAAKCGAETGFKNALTALTSVPVVQAQWCSESPCSGMFIVYDWYDCPPACPQSFKWHYTDVLLGQQSMGWKYTGLEQCRVGGCGGCEEQQCYN